MNIKFRINPSLIGGGLLTTGYAKYFLGKAFVIPIWAVNTSFVLAFIFFGLAVVRETLRIIQEFKLDKIRNEELRLEIENKNQMEREKIHQMRELGFSLEEINLLYNSAIREIIKDSDYNKLLEEYEIIRVRKSNLKSHPDKVIPSTS